MMLISNSLRKCEAPKEYIKVADTFLLHILNGLTVVYCLLSKNLL